MSWYVHMECSLGKWQWKKSLFEIPPKKKKKKKKKKYYSYDIHSEEETFKWLQISFFEFLREPILIIYATMKVQIF